jgi:asparagine N-glycosylation enzyme membrane subunit Stt3
MKKFPFYVLGIILLFCLSIRLSSIFSLYQEGRVLFESPDDQYHMRRILLAIFSPPLGYVDLYTGMSLGKESIWPIYYDLFYALIILIFNFGQHISVEKAELIAAFIPPILGTISAFLLFRLCKDMNAYLSLLAVFLFSILPPNILHSSFSSVDHHVMEVLCYIGLLISWINLVKSKGKKETVLFSCWLVFIFLIWEGSTVYAGFIAITTLVWGIFHKETYFSVSRGFIYGGIILLPFYAYSIDSNNLKLTYDNISLFQPGILITAGLFFSLLDNYEKEKKVSLTLLLPFIILFGIIIFGIIDGLSFIFGKTGGYVVAPTIVEYRSVFMIPLKIIIEDLTIFIFIIPIYCMFILLESLRDQEKILRYVLSLNFLMALGLFFSAWRFEYLLAIFIPPLIVLMVNEIYHKFITGKMMQLFLVYTLVTGLLIFNVYSRDYSILTNYSITYPPFINLFDWIKKNTPESGDYFDPHKEPDYRILAPWDIGNSLVYMSRRAVVSDNSGNNVTKHPSFMVSKSEDEAGKLLIENKVRYFLITSGFVTQPNQYLSLLGISSEYWQTEEVIKTNAGPVTVFLPSQDYLNSIFMRTYFQDGSETEGIDNPAIKQFRLVYESEYKLPVYFLKGEKSYEIILKEKIPPVFKPLFSLPSEYKLFEYVKGAVIEGKTLPNQKLSVFVLVETNTLRKFIYKQTTISNKDGFYSFIVPYGKNDDVPPGKKNITRAISDYVIMNKNKPIKFEVKEKDILNGNKIRIGNILFK